MKKIHLNPELLTKQSTFVDNNTKVYYYEVDSTALMNLNIHFEKKVIQGRELEISNVENGILIKGKYKFLLYNSMEDLTSVFLSAAQGQHHLTGLNPYNKDVFLHKDEIIDKLAFHLNIDKDHLDNTVESLHIIDEALEKINVNKEFIEQNLLGIYLYVGDIFVKKAAGKWKLNYLEHEKLWAPILLDNKGREISLGLPLLEYMEECEGKIHSGLLYANYQRILYMADLP